jgi:hypothetical protein
VWSIAQGADYRAPWESPEFVADTRDLLGDIANLNEIGVAPGDPNATGAGPDVTLFLGLVEGLDADQVHTLVTAVQAHVSDNEVFINQVDALSLTLSKRSLAMP